VKDEPHLVILDDQDHSKTEEFVVSDHHKGKKALGHHLKDKSDIEDNVDNKETNLLIRRKRFVNPFEGLFNLFSSSEVPFYDESVFNGYDQFPELFSDYDSQPSR